LGTINQNLAKLRRIEMRRSVELDLTDLSRIVYGGDGSPTDTIKIE
jgi:hypothetical protein